MQRLLGDLQVILKASAASKNAMELMNPCFNPTKKHAMTQIFKKEGCVGAFLVIYTHKQTNDRIDTGKALDENAAASKNSMPTIIGGNYQI